MLKKKIIALIMVFALMSGSVVYTEAELKQLNNNTVGRLTMRLCHQPTLLVVV